MIRSKLISLHNQRNLFSQPNPLYNPHSLFSLLSL
jgi:hypothetical protein